MNIRCKINKIQTSACKRERDTTGTRPSFLPPAKWSQAGCSSVVIPPRYSPGSPIIHIICMYIFLSYMVVVYWFLKKQMYSICKIKYSKKYRWIETVNGKRSCKIWLRMDSNWIFNIEPIILSFCPGGCWPPVSKGQHVQGTWSNMFNLHHQQQFSAKSPDPPPVLCLQPSTAWAYSIASMKQHSFTAVDEKQGCLLLPASYIPPRA